MFGLLGLGLVAVMTIIAASLPGSEAAAVETNSVTDTIVVRVVGKDPLIEITSDQDGKEIVQQTKFLVLGILMQNILIQRCSTPTTKGKL